MPVLTSSNVGEPVDIVYERDGQRYETTLVPKYDEELGRYLYGFIAAGGREQVGLLETIGYAFCEVGYYIDTTIQSLKMMFSGGISVNDLSGPVGIVQNMGEVYEESVQNDGYFYAMLNMMSWAIMLSANLGVMNLLPIPVLDGGLILFSLIAMVFRRRVPDKAIGYLSTFFMYILMGLMLLLVARDFWRLGKVEQKVEIGTVREASDVQAK